MARSLKGRQFAVRTSLGQKRWDARIQISTNSSAAIVHKPVTYRMLLYLFLDIMLGMWIVMDTPINPAKGGMLGCILFLIGYLGMSRLLLARSETMDYGYRYFRRLISYVMNEDLRKIRTGKLYDARPAYRLMGIAAIGEDGTIIFTNGEYGYLLTVVGYASALLFDQDKAMILDSARVFYRQLPAAMTCNIYTRSMPQDVKVQFDAKLDQLHKLKNGIQSPGLSQIVKAQARVLRDIVGKQFSVTSQYMLLRGTRDSLETVENNLLQNAGSSSAMFLRSARRLTNEPPRYNRHHEAINRPREVDKALLSIWDLNDNSIG